MRNTMISHALASEPSSDEGRWLWVDVFRGIAALLVCSGHLRSVLFVNFGDVQGGQPWAPVFYLSTALGHQAVMIFFVLSGFLVGGSVLRTGSSLFSAREYAIARLSRLWTVLIPALALTLACDLMFKQIAPSVFDGSLRSTWGSTPEPGRHSLGIATLLANLFFLQTFVSPVYGSNAPLWSLAYEFWYYAVFPVVVWIVRGPSEAVAQRVAAASGLGILASFTRAPVLYGFAVWLMGALVWQVVKVPRRRLQQSMTAVSGAALFVGVLLVSVARPVWARTALTDFLLGASFAFLLATLLQQRRQPSLRGRSGTVIRYLSQSSYSLYATHFPLVLGIGVACGTMHRQWQPDLASCTAFVLALCALCGWAQLFWFLTERHTRSVKLMLQKLSLGSSGIRACNPD